jgi:Na+/H+-dicarboxylate symporter
LALWTILLLYNVSEAAFKGGLMWLTFLMGAIAVPGVTRGGIRTVAAVKKTDLDTERVSVSV